LGGNPVRRCLVLSMTTFTEALDLQITSDIGKHWQRGHLLLEEGCVLVKLVRIGALERELVWALRQTAPDSDKRRILDKDLHPGSPRAWV